MKIDANKNAFTVALTVALSLALAALTGCGVAPAGPVSLRGAALHGTVHGGQNPVSGSTIQLYAAGSTGYGSAYTYAAGTSLLGNNTVTTDSSGNFDITSDYTCPTAATEVYLVSSQGNPGLSSGNNANLALMAALGPCGNLSSSTNIIVNELTTVASVWALSPFMTGIANIGTSATNAVGLTNAFASVNKLVNTSTGLVSGPALPAGAVVPAAKLNTLANILAACVNSGGGVTGDKSACGYLFFYTTVNGVAPTDTITAALNMAQHPNTQTANLTYLSGTAPPFQPALPTAPSDFSLVITYSGAGISTPKAIAADASGNVWTANSGSNSATEIDALGATTTDATGYLSGPTGYTVGPLNAPSAVAIDIFGNAWLANAGNSTVTRISPSGATGTVFTGGNLSSPSGLAIDTNNNIWIANNGNSSVTQISSTGVLTNYTAAGITAPTAIAINPK
jgi:streptogramin lyase